MSKSPSSNPIAYTEYGRFALTQLRHLHCLALTICGDNSAFDRRLADEYETQKAMALEQLRSLIPANLQAGMEPEISYTGENGADANKEYTAALEKFVAESVVTRAVDLYHWYIRRVLQLALNRAPSLIKDWAATLGLGKKRLAEIEAAPSTTSALARIFRGNESAFRKLVHEYLDVPDLGAMPLLVEVRNCITHHCGDDIDGRAAALLKDAPELGIEVRNGVVFVSPSAAFEAVGRAFSDIGLFDRMLAVTFALPTSTAALPKFRRVYQ